MVVLRAQLEVAHDDGDLGAGDDEDDKDEEQEAEHVVELVLPDRGEDEEQLDKHCSEGKDSSHQHRDHWSHVPHQLGCLSGDLVDLHRDLRRLFLSPSNCSLIVSFFFSLFLLLAFVVLRRGEGTNRFLEAKVRAEEGEGEGDTDPHGEDANEDACWVFDLI